MSIHDKARPFPNATLPIPFPSEIPISRQVRTASNNKIHISKTNLVDGAFLRGESTDLIRADDNVLLRLAFAASSSTGARAGGRNARPVNSLASASLADDFTTGVFIRRHVPNSDGAVCACGHKDSGFHAPVERPDSPAAVAAHAFCQAAGGEVPEEDLAAVVGGSQHLATLRARNGSTVPNMSREEPDRSPALQAPHPDRAIRATGSGEDVSAVWVPGDGFYVGVVANKEAEGSDLGCAPKAGGAVCGAADEVVAERGEANIPDGGRMGFVDYERRPGVEGPEADGGVC